MKFLDFSGYSARYVLFVLLFCCQHFESEQMTIVCGKNENSTEDEKLGHASLPYVFRYQFFITYSLIHLISTPLVLIRVFLT